MTALDRIITFDRAGGIMRAQAGLSLDDLLRLIVPARYFLATTPGTRFVTLGGAVANDVHGKNHHTAGSFGNAVTRLGLIRSDLGSIEVSHQSKPELFAATIGGLGLTGIIEWVEIKLAPISSAYLEVERQAFANIDEFFGLARISTKTHEHTVAWVDCTGSGQSLGRGILQRGRWCDDYDFTPHNQQVSVTVPIDAPGFMLNPWTLRLFNAAYWRLQKRGEPRKRIHYCKFFYPLDAVGHWNRLYGAKGFYQYQCVVPHATSADAVKAMLAAISKSGIGSFLAVLKTFGSRTSMGLISFPQKGTTLALDFPNLGETAFRLMAVLDEIVEAAGGRLYPAKDARMSSHMFRQGYPMWDAFAAHLDPSFSSDFWRRVTS